MFNDTENEAVDSDWQPREQRSIVEDTVSPLRSFVAPIQRLSFDVLGLIFREAQNHARTSLAGLMLVCRSWRDAVIGHPTLWSYIHFARQDFIPKTLRRGRAPPIVRLHLERSRDAPLDIAIGFPKSEHIHGTCVHEVYHHIADCPEVENSHLRLQFSLETLAGDEGKNMKRWRSFIFRHSEPHLLNRYCHLNVLHHPVPQLQTLLLSNWTRPGLFKEVPQLTSLNLPEYNGTMLVAPSMPSVTDICIEMPWNRFIHPNSVFQPLSCCNRVQRVKIFGFTPLPRYNQIETISPIRLASLQHLEVRIRVSIDYVLATLDLPNLVSLSFHEFDISRRGDVLPRGPWTLWFPNLRQFTFDSRASEATRMFVLRRLLDEAQSLEVLSVGSRFREYVSEMLDADHGLCPSLRELQVIPPLDPPHGAPIVVPFPTRLAVQSQPNS